MKNPKMVFKYKMIIELEKKKKEAEQTYKKITGEEYLPYAGCIRGGRTLWERKETSHWHHIVGQALGIIEGYARAIEILNNSR